MYEEYQLKQVREMSQFPSPCFRLLTALGSLPYSRTKYFVQGHRESLGHSREMIGGVRPLSYLLTTLLLYTIHNPITQKNLPLQLHRPDASVKGVVFRGERYSLCQLSSHHEAFLMLSSRSLLTSHCHPFLFLPSILLPAYTRNC